MNTRTCADRSCGKPLPADADRRMKFCGEACRKRNNRLKLATERTGTPAKPQDAAQRDESRYEDLRRVWRMLIASVTAQGVLVPGSAGVPVAHPALRFISQLDAQLLKHESHPSESEGDDLDKLIAKMLAATDENGMPV